jgi:hypothetical protein
MLFGAWELESVRGSEGRFGVDVYNLYVDVSCLSP